MHCILGSASPRRAAILEFFDIDFIQIPSCFREESIPFSGDPVLYVRTLAEAKGAELSSRHPEALILTADTVVYLDGKIYNKPVDEEEATRFLLELSGKEHFVYTALSVSKRGTVKTEIEKTGVTFYPIEKETIPNYLHAIGYQDKAGGYSVERGGSLLVRKFDGCYYNVLGLPLHALQVLLHSEGIDLRERIRPV